MGFMTSLVSRPEKSAITQAEMARDPLAWLGETGGNLYRTSAGVNVTENNAIALSAVFASARAIAEDVACMPLKTYRRLPDGGKESASDEERWYSLEFDAEVNTYDLVHDAPNPEMSDMTFRSLLIWWAMLWGNGYAEIVRDDAGNPIAMWPVHPHLTEPKRDDGGRLYYQVRDREGKRPSRDIPARDMHHIHGMSDDGVVGLMMTKYAKESFGIYMAAEQHTGSFFGNGATLLGVITMDKAFGDEESRRKWLRGFNAAYTGARNAFKWGMIDGPNVKVQPIAADPEKSQLVETIKFRVEDVARWFRVPPVMIGHNTATPYSNVESLFRVYHATGLKPWALRIEKESTRKLLGGKPDLFAEHVVDSLMWADAKTRTEVHAMRIRSGMASPNEAREIENMNPYTGGDAFRVEQNLAVIDESGQPVQVNQPQADQPATPSPTDGTAAYKVAAMPMFVDAAERMIAREAKAFGAKRNPDAAWIDKFYEGHRGEVAAAFGPPIATLSRLAGTKADGLAERYADMHVGESRRRLQEGGDPQSWATDRPAWIARFLTDEVCNG